MKISLAQNAFLRERLAAQLVAGAMKAEIEMSSSLPISNNNSIIGKCIRLSEKPDLNRKYS